MELEVLACLHRSSSSSRGNSHSSVFITSCTLQEVFEVDASLAGQCVANETNHVCNGFTAKDSRQLSGRANILLAFHVCTTT